MGENYFDIALVDLYIPQMPGRFDHVMRGEDLTYTIRGKLPHIKIIGMSERLVEQPRTALPQLFDEFIQKDQFRPGERPLQLLRLVEQLLAPDGRKPNVFIVHGHDEGLVLTLKNYLQNVLALGEPVILKERPSGGRTVIEKFEREASSIDLVFVLLTPDDGALKPRRVDARRARQNVILELGYFYAKLRRSSGRILVLRKGKTDVPSDLSGVVYIDVSRGVEYATDNIRRELKALGWVA